MYQFMCILKMDLKNLFMNLQWWFYTICLPLFMALVVGFLVRGSYGKSITSYDYYGITLLVYGALNTATIAANSFMENRILKANMRLINAPIKSFYIYFPKVLASFIFSLTGQTIAGFILFFFLHVNYGKANVLLLWLLLFVVDFCMASLSIMLCCLLKNEEAVNQLLSNFTAIFCLLGGTFFPIKGFGQLTSALSSISPVTWINAAAFQTVYDNNLSLLFALLILLPAISVLWIGLSAKFFHQEDYL